MTESRDWRLRAACLNQEPDLFFPEGTMGPALEMISRAKQVCAGCPVRARCLEWALDNGAYHGVWGGRTEEERRGSASRLSRLRREQGEFHG